MNDLKMIWIKKKRLIKWKILIKSERENVK